MKKESIDPLPFPHTQVSTLPISTSTEANSTIGAVVGIPKTPPSAMDSANGSSLDADLFLSTFQSPGISSFAIVNYLPIHHSAMELTSTYIVRQLGIIEAFGVSTESLPSGEPSPTGCLLSTSELP